MHDARCYMLLLDALHSMLDLEVHSILDIQCSMLDAKKREKNKKNKETQRTTKEEK